jgi:hypothetical protein
MSATFLNDATQPAFGAERRVVVAGCLRRRRQHFVLQRPRRRDERQFALEAAAHQHAWDEHAVDLVRALEDPVDPGVAEIALGHVVADEAVAAVDLHVLVEHEVERFGAHHLADRRLDRELLERAGLRGAALIRLRDAASMSPAVR